jgi:3-deoxy-7-phosphoheptulonate synthase
METNPSSWSKLSWREHAALQQPNWPDQKMYEQVLQEISLLPPLVFAGEIRSLKEMLAEAADGRAFLLQGGDCAEDFSRCTAPAIRDSLKVILQMAVILTYAGGKPVIKMGRMAGQYAKPRSSDTEVINGQTLPSYRGDMVNSPEPTPQARRPDPQRLLKGYFLAASTMNIMRAFTRGGYAALHRVHAWNTEFVKNSPQGQSYEKLARHIDQALNFMRVIGIDTSSPQLNQVDFYTSHEALLLGYEEALTRQDSTTGNWYDCSAHMIWIGDRTRQLDGAHVEFCRGIPNPIGVKVGPGHDLDEIKKLAAKLNPENEPGRLTFITRFGAGKIERYLPPLIRAIKEEGCRVLWSCDPMHGNTYTAESGHKTRNFDEILREIRAFFEVHWAEGTVPGGVHFELTGENVTECTGGGRKILDQHLIQNYRTTCDPRLNAEQSLEAAFQIAEMIRG